MSSRPVSDQQVLEALHRVHPERWPEILEVIENMTSPPIPEMVTPPHPFTGADLANSDLIGIWADRADITDNREFARRLRHQASHRQCGGRSDVAGQ